PERALEILLERDGVVVDVVLRAEYERDGSGAAKLDQTIEPIGVSLELRVISLAEFVPAVRRVPQPLAKLVARCGLLQPFVDRGVFLTQSARPQAIDEDAPAVRLRRRVVRALDADPGLSSHRSPSFVRDPLGRERDAGPVG